MMFQMFFLFAFSYLVLEVAGTGSPSSLRLPDVLQELCPGAKVCQENLTFPAAMRTFLPGVGSCCADCSCSSDCEERGNCCFPHNLSSKEGTDGGTNTAGATSTCLFPTTRQPEDRKLYQSYSMVSKIPNSLDDDQRTQSNISCGDEDVAPWGSFYPVYSAKQKRIYKNIACAKADGVTDGKLWDAVLACSTIDNFGAWTDSNSFTERCKVDFIYQGKSEDIQPLICYSDLIDTCPPLDEFEVTAEMSVSKKDVIELCTNGLVSPYTAEDMYANVFCHICNDEPFMRSGVCLNTNQFTARGQNRHRFVGLIDDTFITEARSTRGTADVQVACTKAQNGKCRQIVCPLGQLRSPAGECTYPIKTWYYQVFTLYIKLKSDTPIDVNEVFQIQDLDWTMKLPAAFKLPWSNNWYIDSVYYDREGGQKPTVLVAILKNKVTSVQPMNFMKYIRKVITEDWLLETGNVTLALKSSFMPFTTPRFFDASQTLFANLSQSLALSGFQKLYEIGEFSMNKFYVTNLYFCNLVELTEQEFILGPDHDILFNKMTKRFLLNGEFILVSSSTFLGIRARICIEDSGLYKTENNIISGTETVSELYVCLYFAMVLLILN